MGIPDHLTWLLRNLCAGQEATVRTGHEAMDWFQLERGVHQGCILSPCLFNLYTEYSYEISGWMKLKLESRLLGEISITSDMHANGRKRRGTKMPLHESKGGEWKSWLKTQHSKHQDHSIWSHYFMANRWGSNGNSNRLHFLGLQSLPMVTAAMKLKELAPWKKSYDKPRQCIKKQRHYFAYKGLYIQAMVFPVVMVQIWELDHKEG